MKFLVILCLSCVFVFGNIDEVTYIKLDYLKKAVDKLLDKYEFTEKEVISLKERVSTVESSISTIESKIYSFNTQQIRKNYEEEYVNKNYFEISTAVANIRSEPSLKSNVVGWARRGDKVEITDTVVNEEGYPWVKLKERNGYMSVVVGNIVVETRRK